MKDLPTVDVYATPDEGFKRLEEMTQVQLIYAVRDLGRQLLQLQEAAHQRRMNLFDRPPWRR